MGWIIFSIVYVVGMGCAALWCRFENLATPEPFDQRPVWLYSLLWWVLLVHWTLQQMERHHFHRQLHRQRRA